MMNEAFVIVVFVDAERYVFMYDASSTRELINTICRFAQDPELSFDWAAAATVSDKVKAIHDSPT